MKFKLTESIEKQPNVEYKGYTIEHFPVNWSFGEENWDQDGWVIQSPYYFQLSDDTEKVFIPLYCEDEEGEVMNFLSLDAAKLYIDTYMVTNKGRIKLKHGDEVHYEINEITEGTEKVKDHEWVNKGKDGTHGKFKTKKEADAQRKAMFANGWKG